MFISLHLEHAWNRFFAFNRYEDDPGFRDVILRLCRKGMVVAGTLGIVGTLVFIGAHVVAGRSLVWLDYSQPETLALWDKFVLIGLSVITLMLSRTRSGPRQGRLIVAFMIFVVSIASLLDDLARDDVAFSAGYLSLWILVAVGTMPYRPGQVFAFSAGVSGLLVLCIRYGPSWLGLERMEMDAGPVVFIVIITLISTGICWLLYTVRYEQYLARRKAEELGRRVARLEQVKSRFFANVSHEFRTPLSLILGPVEDALRAPHDPAPGALRRQLLLMRRSGLRLQRLINQLLDLSKLEAGRMHLHVRLHNLNKFLRFIVSSFSLLAERKHISLTFEAAAGAEDYLLYFDADKLEQVITNLLANALKFTPAYGKVHVSLCDTREEAGEWVEVYIRDTGAGIPKDALSAIFDRFEQVDAPLTPGDVGTGIGLALAKELTEAHGGTIRVESEPGFGSTFVVRLRRGHAHFSPQDMVDAAVEPGARPPLADDLSTWEADDLDGDDDDAHDNDAMPPEEAPTILIVDDDADMREYLRSLLGALYHVEEAADGVEGLDKARHSPPALIVSDVIMPRLDGYALCRAVKTDEALNHIPVILLTARTEQEAEQEGLETGADDYIHKPFHAETLLLRVENLIELRRRLRQRFSEEVVLQPSAIAVPSIDAEFLERVRTVVEDKMENSNFGVEWLADEVGVSPRHLQRKLRALTRLSAKGFINMMRLQRAAQLLEQQAGTVAEVAYAVGFQDAGYFSKLFKQTFGVTPSAFGQQPMRQKGHLS